MPGNGIVNQLEGCQLCSQKTCLSDPTCSFISSPEQLAIIQCTTVTIQVLADKCLPPLGTCSWLWLEVDHFSGCACGARPPQHRKGVLHAKRKRYSIAGRLGRRFMSVDLKPMCNESHSITGRGSQGKHAPRSKFRCKQKKAWLLNLKTALKNSWQSSPRRRMR